MFEYNVCNWAIGQSLHEIDQSGYWENWHLGKSKHPNVICLCDISTSPSGDNVQAPPKQRRRGKAAFILKLIYKEQKYRVASQERYLSET